MSSTITNYSANIDTRYPIPGADNNTQGFRDNFIAIKNSLDIAASEITDIQVIQTGLTLSIPTSISAFTNDVGYLTSSTVNQYLNSGSGATSYLTLTDKPFIPTDLSSLTNVNNAFTSDDVPQGIENLYLTKDTVDTIFNDTATDSVEAEASPASADELTNTLTLTDDLLIDNFKVGQKVRIYGCSTNTDYTLLGTVNTPSVTKVGFLDAGTSSAKYKVVQFNFSDGKTSAPSAESTAVTGLNTEDFNLTNNVIVRVNRTNTNYGSLVYRQMNGSGDFKLIAVLGTKEFQGNLTTSYTDYYAFDYNAWTTKSPDANEFISTSGVVHFPIVVPAFGNKGWTSNVVTGVNTTTKQLTFETSLYYNSSVLVSHDDTAMIQNAIDAKSAANTNLLRLGSKNYITSNLTLPSGFKLYGTSQRSQLKKLAWSTGDAGTNKILGTTDNAVLDNITVASLSINGNMQNQYLVDERLDPYSNFSVDIKGSNHTFDSILINNTVGGGIASTSPANLTVTGCRIEGGGLSDRYDISPLIIDGGDQLLITNNVFKNYPGSIDSSVATVGVLNGNIVYNCGSGILVYGSTNLVSSPNVILGPAGEYIPGPDILNSEFDAVNIMLEPGVDYISDSYVYQENGQLFDLTANNGELTYSVDKLRKVNNVEELYGEVLTQDPTTSSIHLICPLNAILNTDLVNGEFRFFITRAAVNTLTSVYSYSTLSAIEPNHVGLTYRALLTEYSSVGSVTSATLISTGLGISYVEIVSPDLANVGKGSPVKFQNFGGTPNLDSIIGTLVDYPGAIPNQYLIAYDTNISALGAVIGTTQLVTQHTFVLAKGRIL